MAMTINQESRPEMQRGQRLIAVGSLLGALAASSCCICRCSGLALARAALGWQFHAGSLSALRVPILL
jgi:hypothetical protein